MPIRQRAPRSHRSRIRRRSPLLRHHLPRIPARAVPLCARAARCRCLCRTIRAALRRRLGSGRPPSRPQTEHPHAVGEVLLIGPPILAPLAIRRSFVAMHPVAARGAAKMRETGPAHETPRRLGMIDRHQQTPRRRAGVNRIVVERLGTRAPFDQRRQRRAGCDRALAQVPARSRRPRAAEETAPRRARHAASNRASAERGGCASRSSPLDVAAKARPLLSAKPRGRQSPRRAPRAGRCP